MSDRYAAWIEQQIEDHRPSGDHAALYRLATSCEALATERGQVFGMAYPTHLARREELLAKALDALRAWVPRLGDGAMHQVEQIVQRANLPIELAARKAELAERRRPPVDARFTHLERAIADDPDDLTAFAVLADALQRDGDPRGELIALQVAAETDRAKASFAERYLDEHRAELLGPLAEVPVTAYTWRRGYVHRLRLGDGVDGEVLAHVLEHPAGRFLHEAVVGVIGNPGDGLIDVIRVLGVHGAPSLRVLHLGDFVYPDESELSWFDVGDIDPLWHGGVPRLRHLITQGHITASAIEHPALERLEVRTGGLPAAAARAIANARVPHLAYLEVWYGDSSYGAEATLDDIAPLLARRDLPALRHLGLRNCELADAIAEALPRSALLPQLATLDLSLGTLSDDGAHAIAAHADAFRHLKRIDVSGSWLGADAIRALRRIGPDIVAEDQRAATADERYVSFGE